MKSSQWQQQYAQRIALVFGFERDSILFLFFFTPIQLIYPSQRHIWPEVCFLSRRQISFQIVSPSSPNMGHIWSYDFARSCFILKCFDLSFILFCYTFIAVSFTQCGLGVIRNAPLKRLFRNFLLRCLLLRLDWHEDKRLLCHDEITPSEISNKQSLLHQDFHLERIFTTIFSQCWHYVYFNMTLWNPKFLSILFRCNQRFQVCE